MPSRRDLMIYVRDSWLCQMPDCLHPDGRAIDPAVLWPAPWSVSTDHVLPRSRGGTNQEANKRAAHLRCNILGFRVWAALPSSRSKQSAAGPYCEPPDAHAGWPPWTPWDDLTRQSAHELLISDGHGGLTAEDADRLLRKAARRGTAAAQGAHSGYNWVDVAYDSETKRYFLRLPGLYENS
jgi:hypothetical protein